MNCKESLKEYIDKDEIYQDYKQNKLMNPSDFDKFCIQHCKDIEELLEENLELKENNISMQEEMVRTWKKTDLYKEVIDEVRKYITSYSSIHTIQFGTEEDSLNDIELNKTLDEKTITEMTHRYLKIHDKLLQILDKAMEN